MNEQPEVDFLLSPNNDFKVSDSEMTVPRTLSQLPRPRVNLIEFRSEV